MPHQRQIDTGTDFIAEILNMQIALCMLQLFLNRDQLMSAADADAEQPCQGIDHLHGIFIASGFAHPGDRIQCIIEEMWIDLCLKCLQFCFSKADLFLADFFHQLLDPYCHMFKRIRQSGNLFGSRHRIDRQTRHCFPRILPSHAPGL